MVLEDGNFWKLVEAYDASQEAARQKEATGGEKTQLTVSPSSLAILQSLLRSVIKLFKLGRFVN